MDTMDEVDQSGAMSRRRFLRSAAVGAGASILVPHISLAEAGNAVAAGASGTVESRTPQPWYKSAYRRNVIDMHITDFDPAFLSKFDPDVYVQRLTAAKVKSAVLYAHSHVGLCYFPTTVGKTHAAYEGKDLLARTISGLRANGIAVALYMSLIHDTWAYRNHEDWKIRRTDGQGASEGGRYGICCPNAPYRDYIATLATEVCDQYEFEGLRFDMTFWPRVCYCAHCAKRFADEAGGELPRVVNWEDPRWVAFQRRREAWLVEFAHHMTQTVKQKKPNVTVEHQSSTFTANFRLGVTEPLAAENDFLQGDFYGDAVQGSLIRKLFYNLTPNQPYAFETSVMVSLHNHTALKPEALLEAKASACVADGGAFVFIDAIDPAGTINPATYETMGRVFEKTIPYEEHTGGELVQDVAVYLSTESKFDFAQNGKDVEDYSAEGTPHIDALVGACRALRAHHVPYGVITKKDLQRLDRHKVLVLPNVLMMDAAEMAAITAWVEQGGLVYASRETSLVTKDGVRHEDFQLGALFGAKHEGTTGERVTYIAPTEPGVLGAYTNDSPLMVNTTQRTIVARDGAQVLGTLVLPYTNPDDGETFASIHSNPPGVWTERPAIVMNTVGQGRALYVADAIERYDYCDDIFVGLIYRLGLIPMLVARAPACVEFTSFHQPDRKRFVVTAVNFQKDLPNVPISGASVELRMHSTTTRVRRLPNGSDLVFIGMGSRADYLIPPFETIFMVAFEYA